MLTSLQNTSSIMSREVLVQRRAGLAGDSLSSTLAGWPGGACAAARNSGVGTFIHNNRNRPIMKHGDGPAYRTGRGSWRVPGYCGEDAARRIRPQI